MNVTKQLPFCILRNSLLTIYKTYVQSHSDYADIIYEKPTNMTSESKLKRVKYNACL